MALFDTPNDVNTAQFNAAMQGGQARSPVQSIGQGASMLGQAAANATGTRSPEMVRAQKIQAIKTHALNTVGGGDEKGFLQAFGSGLVQSGLVDEGLQMLKRLREVEAQEAGTLKIGSETKQNIANSRQSLALADKARADAGSAVADAASTRANTRITVDNAPANLSLLKAQGDLERAKVDETAANADATRAGTRISEEQAPAAGSLLLAQGDLERAKVDETTQAIARSKAEVDKIGAEITDMLKITDGTHPSYEALAQEQVDVRQTAIKGQIAAIGREMGVEMSDNPTEEEIIGVMKGMSKEDRDFLFRVNTTQTTLDQAVAARFGASRSQAAPASPASGSTAPRVTGQRTITGR